MAQFEKHIEKLIVKEGGYKLINVKNDRGGQTYAGIARNFNPEWDGWDYVDSGQPVPKSAVHAYYKRNYWDALKLDDVRSDATAEVMFSCCVLSG